jgi:O-antigen/teichoic acid export membrane protein
MAEIISVPPPDLFSRTIRGGVWVFISRVFLQILTAVKILVLARLLSPREIGIISFVMIFIEAFEIFTQTGFFAALVQKKEKVEDYIHSVWTLSMVRGIVLSAAVFFLSPFVVRFFDSSGRFEPGNFIKPVELAVKITSPSSPLSSYLLNSFSPTGKQKIKNHLTLSGRELEKLLADELNALCQKETLYSPQRFSGIALSAYAASILPQSTGVSARLNRLALEEAFPAEIQRLVLDVPRVTAVFQTLGFLFLIYGINNSRLFLLTRNLEFHKTFYLQGTQSFCGLAVTLVLAWWLRNVWALVFGQLFSAVLGSILGYVMVPYRPRWNWDRHKVWQLWKFGRHVTLVDVLGFFTTRIDSFFVGKMLGMTAVGYYRYAFQLVELTTREVGGVFSMVSFPAFSQIQDNVSKIRNGYHKAMQMVSLVGFPCSGLMLVLAPNIVYVLLGETWLPAVPAMRILCLLGIFSGLNQSRSVFFSLNRPDILVKLILLRIGLLAFLLYPMTNMMGIAGTAAAMVVSSFLVIPIGLIWTKQFIQSGFAEFFKSIWIPGGAVILTTGMIWPLQRLSDTRSFFWLAGLGGLGIAVYILFVWFLDKILNRSEILRMVRETLSAAMKQNRDKS